MVGSVIWNFWEQDNAIKADCMIVLGAVAYGDEPSPVFEERIKHALELYQKGYAPVLIFTGGFGKGATHSESEVAALYAIKNNIPAQAILTESQSKTTNGNLIEAKVLMGYNNLKTAIIVSDSLHLKRAFMMASGLNIESVTSPTPTSLYRSLRVKLNFLIREIYFCHHFMLTGN